MGLQPTYVEMELFQKVLCVILEDNTTAADALYYDCNFKFFNFTCTEWEFWQQDLRHHQYSLNLHQYVKLKLLHHHASLNKNYSIYPCKDITTATLYQWRFENKLSTITSIIKIQSFIRQKLARSYTNKLRQSVQTIQRFFKNHVYIDTNHLDYEFRLHDSFLILKLFIVIIT